GNGRSSSKIARKQQHDAALPPINTTYNYCLAGRFCQQAVSIVLTIGGGLLMWNESIGARALSFNPQYTILWQSTNAEELVDKAFRNLLQLVAPAGQTYFITGIILIIFCLAALYGLLRKADIFVIIYGGLIMLFVLMHAILLGLYFGQKEQRLNFVENFLQLQVDQYVSIDSQTIHSVTLTIIMEQLHCCGLNNATDFHRSSAAFVPHDSLGQFSFPNISYPLACCMQLPTTDPNRCPRNFTPANSYINHGCKEPLFAGVISLYDLIANLSIIVLIMNAITLIIIVSGYVWVLVK
ncbi:hypothetical protein PHET_00801, partial [Paragonimus heterotremus]